MSKLIKSVIRYIILFLISLFLVYFCAQYSVEMYKFFYPLSGSGSIGVLDFTPVVVLPLEYLFFTIFLFTAFGDSNKYWWASLLSLPIIILVLYIDWEYIYVPVIIGLVGWLVGFAVSKVIVKFVETGK